jgi:hypothetical protein
MILEQRLVFQDIRDETEHRLRQPSDNRKPSQSAALFLELRSLLRADTSLTMSGMSRRANALPTSADVCF